jgi:hypothetical protein
MSEWMYKNDFDHKAKMGHGASLDDHGKLQKKTRGVGVKDKTKRPRPTSIETPYSLTPIIMVQGSSIEVFEWTKRSSSTVH